MLRLKCHSFLFKERFGARWISRAKVSPLFAASCFREDGGKGERAGGREPGPSETNRWRESEGRKPLARNNRLISVAASKR